ncbi:MAG: hypothetical protein KGJ07_00190 [Patescibacteria group bacterium]|nr:hypothetical protein [Patescibacteria group bacterium]
MKTKEEITQMFLMFQTIYLKKWTDNFATVEILEIAMEQWRKGLNGIENSVIEKAIDYCRLNLVWPPSIAEFIGICDQCDGMPIISEIIPKILNRDFSHAIIEIVYEKVGSWAFSRDSSKELEKKVKKAYKEALITLRNGRMKLLK